MAAEYRDDLIFTLGAVTLHKLAIPGDLPSPTYEKQVETVYMRSGGPNAQGLRVLNDRGFHVSWQDFEFEAGYVTPSQIAILEDYYATRNTYFSFRIEWTDNVVDYEVAFKGNGFRYEPLELTHYGLGQYRADIGLYILRRTS